MNGFVRSFIETTGYEVFPARNWKEALAKLKEESPEIAEAYGSKSSDLMVLKQEAWQILKEEKGGEIQNGKRSGLRNDGLRRKRSKT